MRHSLIALLALVAPAALPASFTNVTTDVGLNTPGFRLSVADVNGDGYPDLLLHRTQDEATGDVLNKQYLFLNQQCAGNPDPHCRVFVDATAGSGIRANRAGTNEGRHQDGAVFADVDNDGDLDMFSITYVHRSYTLDKGRNDLMLNDGLGHFTLAPLSTFHTEPIWNTAAAVFADYDNDGRIDLFLANWYNTGDLPIEQKLYKGAGTGAFTNVTATSGIAGAASAVYGAASADWNNDGFADFFAADYGWTVIGSKSIHWKNNLTGTFTRYEDTSKYSQYTGFPTGMASFGSMPRDYDNDGDVDLLEVLTHGKGDGDGTVHSTVLTNTNNVFSWDFFRVKNRATEDTDLTHHGDHYATWFDYDNDGLADFALSECCYTQPAGGENNRIYLFRQAADHTFSPVTVASGLNAVNTLPGNPRPHNVIALDYDRDGDEDLIVGFADDVTPIELWRNDVGTLNHWVTVTVRGAGVAKHANRAGIGARVEVTTGGTTYTREVYAGNGHMGPQAPLALSFGIGAATTIDRIRVRWPNQALSTTEVLNVAANQFVTLDEPCVRPAEPSQLTLRRAGANLVLSWADPAVAGLTWTVHRGSVPNPAAWGAPVAQNVTDGDATTPGIQWTDTGAGAPPATLFYLVGAVNECGEGAFGL